jgi:hypothetical protein
MKIRARCHHAPTTTRPPSRSCGTSPSSRAIRLSRLSSCCRTDKSQKRLAASRVSRTAPETEVTATILTSLWLAGGKEFIGPFYVSFGRPARCRWVTGITPIPDISLPCSEATRRHAVRRRWDVEFKPCAMLVMAPKLAMALPVSGSTNFTKRGPRHRARGGVQLRYAAVRPPSRPPLS